MEKMDRLGWAAGISFSTYGLLAGVRVSDRAVLGRVAERLPPGWAPAPSPCVRLLYSLKVGGTDPRRNTRSYHLLYVGLQRLARTMDLDLALEELESHLQWQVAEHAPNRVLVHAGAVGWRGRAIVLPGYSFSGKSTLVAELLKLGATYYSDEYAVLDARGHVHPYPRRLSLRATGDLPRRRCTPGDLGSTAGSAPLPVGLVAAARYRPAAHWRPRSLTPGQAVWELLSCTLSAQRRPEAALNALQQAVAGAACRKGFRGEAAETARLLLQEVEADGPGSRGHRLAA
jgi:hypothetical protein